jgi:acetyl esterase
VADLQLRGRAGPLRTRIHWPPAPGAPVARPLLLALPAAGADTLWAGVSALTEVVVLAVSDTRVTRVPDSAALAEATTAVQWVADHAEELHADPRRLFVGGEGTGAWLAAAVALQARDEGWPSLVGQLLVVTSTSGIAAGAAPLLPPRPGQSLAGVAPAIVVTVGDGPHEVDAHRYAARLRAAGVRVDEVRHDDPATVAAACLAPTLRRALAADGVGRA